MATYNGAIISLFSDSFGHKYTQKKVIIHESFSHGPKDIKLLNGRFIFDKEFVNVDASQKTYDGQLIEFGQQGERDYAKYEIVFTPTMVYDEPLSNDATTDSKTPRILDGAIMGGDSANDKSPRVSPQEITWKKSN